MCTDYSPSKVAAGIAGVLYVLAGLLLFARLTNTRSWWGLCLPIAAISKLRALLPIFLYRTFVSVTGTGYFMRIALVSSPNSVGLFSIEQIFIIVTPAAFLAYNYILYGRFIVNCVDPKHSSVRPNRVARIFVGSDIITFLVQVGFHPRHSLHSSSL
jgi:hypothetical protein